MNEGGKLNRRNAPERNRGFELMLKHRSRKEEAPKLFHFKVDKVLSLFGREIGFVFNLQLDSRKKKTL